LEQATQHALELVQATRYTDSTAFKNALRDDAAAAAGVASGNVTVTAWLECSNDGVKLDYTGSCASSTAPFARYVTIKAQKSYSPLFGSRFFPGADVNGSITLSATSGMRTQ
jgi:hypothetical protein